MLLCDNYFSMYRQN